MESITWKDNEIKTVRGLLDAVLATETKDELHALYGIIEQATTPEHTKENFKWLIEHPYDVGANADDALRIAGWLDMTPDLPYWDGKYLFHFGDVATALNSMTGDREKLEKFVAYYGEYTEYANNNIRTMLLQHETMDGRVTEDNAKAIFATLYPAEVYEEAREQQRKALGEARQAQINQLMAMLSGANDGSDED